MIWEGNQVESSSTLVFPALMKMINTSLELILPQNKSAAPEFYFIREKVELMQNKSSVMFTKAPGKNPNKNLPLIFVKPLSHTCKAYLILSAKLSIRTSFSVSSLRLSLQLIPNKKSGMAWFGLSNDLDITQILELLMAIFCVNLIWIKSSGYEAKCLGIIHKHKMQQWSKYKPSVFVCVCVSF